MPDTGGGTDTAGWNFTFWCLLRQPDGSYVARPYVTLYEGMVEIRRYGATTG